jgi:hypothetical protein
MEEIDSFWAKKYIYISGDENNYKKSEFIISKHPIKSLTLSIFGGLSMYFLGRIVGTGLEYIPYVSEAFNSFSGNNVYDLVGGVKGLLGILAGTYGFAKSGLKVNDDNLDLEKIVLSPLCFNIYEKDKNSYEINVRLDL